MVEAGGVDALSMRKLAAELDVAHTAIYWHVGSRDDLVGAVIDAFLADLGDITPTGRTPRAHGVGRARRSGARSSSTARSSRSRWSRVASRGCGSRRRSRSRARSARRGVKGAEAARGHLAAVPRRRVRDARGRVRGTRPRGAGDGGAVAGRRGPAHRPRTAHAHGARASTPLRSSRTPSKPCWTGSWPRAKGTDGNGIRAVQQRVRAPAVRRRRAPAHHGRGRDRAGRRPRRLQVHVGDRAPLPHRVLAPLGQRGVPRLPRGRDRRASTSARASSTSRRR